VLAYIDTIVDFVKPTDLLFIAVDGIPPFGKMIQQRQRRFLGGWTKNQAGIEEWSSDAISPGTQFMKDLTYAISDHLDNMTGPTRAIFSPHDEPGEGEFKIFKYIKDSKAPITSDVVYGLDADLIMLSILNKPENLFLLREPVHFGKNVKSLSPFVLFDVHRFSLELKKTLEETYGFDPLGDTLANYVFLCFFMGNDFVRPLSYIQTRNGGMRILLEKYMECRLKQPSKSFLDKNGNPDTDFLKEFLRAMSSDENDKFKDHFTKYMNFRSRGPESIETIPLQKRYPVTINPTLSTWRQYYYHTLFGKKANISQISESYLKSIYWTHSYYFKQKCDMIWHYPWGYSPSAVDASNYLEMNGTESLSIFDGPTESPFTMNMQLLYILPIYSIHLLPEHLQEYMTDISKGYTHYYPKTCKIQTFYKYFLHECNIQGQTTPWVRGIDRLLSESK
jgi:5'-3' exonuclease